MCACTPFYVAGDGRGVGQHCPFADAYAWRIPTVFSWLQQQGRLSEEEMARTFNCGVGAALVVRAGLEDDVLWDIQRQEEAWVIGRVVARPEGNGCLLDCSSLRHPNCACAAVHAGCAPFVLPLLWHSRNRSAATPWTHPRMSLDQG